MNYSILAETVEKGNQMSKTTFKFIQWYESKYPEFVNRYGALKRLYDSDLDSFFIEEINDAYEEFKRSLI